MRKDKEVKMDKQMQREGTGREDLKVEIKEENTSPDQGNRVNVSVQLKQIVFHLRSSNAIYN